MKAANDNWPRGMRRAVAAAYLGISPSHFDVQRALGEIPAPHMMLGVELFDRTELDALFETSSIVVSNDNDSDYWDRECAINGNQNT
jgi:hypothetical protein